MSKFNLCIFDCDNTLLNTDPLSDLRFEGKNNQSERYKNLVESKCIEENLEVYFSEEFLYFLQCTYPQIRFSIFTRAPSSYIEAIDRVFYKFFIWDWLVSYESILDGNYKPKGDGIKLTMRELQVSDSNTVVMVGDDDVDIRSAYHAGCWGVLFTKSWGREKRGSQWNALSLMPDAVLEDEREFLSFLEEPERFLPLLEDRTGLSTRIDEISHFHIAERGKPYKVCCVGRYFSNHPSLSEKRLNHELTKEIIAYKDKTEFPVSWGRSVYLYIVLKFPKIRLRKQKLIITAIPPRLGRLPRLNYLLKEVERYINDVDPEIAGLIEIQADVMRYADGALSHSKNKLNQADRFENVENHLFVNYSVRGRDLIVIDDVVTTGATLITSSKKLKQAGARVVHLFSITKTVSDVL